MKYIFPLILTMITFVANAQCYKPYIEQGKASFAQKRYHEAVANWEEALRCKDITPKIKAQILKDIKKAESLYAQDPYHDIPHKATGVKEPLPPSQAEKSDPDTTVFTIVEQMPEFPDGQAAIFKYFTQNLRIPFMDPMCCRFYVGFIVEKDGTLSNIHVKKSSSEEATKEVVRLISNMPKWNAGKRNGKLVRVKYSLPIRIRLE